MVKIIINNWGSESEKKKKAQARKTKKNFLERCDCFIVPMADDNQRRMSNQLAGELVPVD